MLLSSEQNKASFITLVSLLLLFVFLFLFKWQTHQTKSPVIQDFLEVNLGNVENSAGDIPVLKEGNGGQVNETPTHSAVAPPEPISETENVTDKVDAVAQNEKEIPAVKPIEKKKVVKKITPVPKPIPKPTPKLITPKPIAQPLAKKEPLPKAEVKPIVQKVETIPEKQIAPPAPKAVFGGTKNNGGNGAATSNGVTSQGIGKAELGDMGKPNGNINSNNYEGNGGNGGTQINMSSDLIERGIANMPKFEADFTQNANVKIEIKVNENGDASFVRIVKTNTINPAFINIIKQKLLQIKFKPKDDESFGTIDFNFKVGR